MFELLHVSGFQRHSDRVVDLNHPVTALVGETEAGKSSLVRALFWACFNRPSGDSFVKAGHEECVVRLKVDGRKVLRKRGGGNYYRLDGEKLSAIGTTVPGDVADLLAVSRDNFQLQHEPAYWFALTPGELSKKINEVTNLTLIDQTLSRAKSEVNKARQTAAVCADMVTEARKRSESLKWVKAFDKELRKVEFLEEQWKKAASRASALAAAVVNLRLTRSRVEKARRRAAGLEALARAGDRYALASDRRTRLEELLGRIKSARVKVSRPPPDLTELLTVRAAADAVAEKRRRLEYLVQDIREMRAETCRLKELAERLEASLPKSSKCPACGGPLPPARASSSAPTSTPARKPRLFVPSGGMTGGRSSPTSSDR